jgi:hypothetical protein
LNAIRDRVCADAGEPEREPILGAGRIHEIGGQRGGLDTTCGALAGDDLRRYVGDVRNRMQAGRDRPMSSSVGVRSSGTITNPSRSDGKSDLLKLPT